MRAKEVGRTEWPLKLPEQEPVKLNPLEEALNVSKRIKQAGYGSRIFTSYGAEPNLFL